jgi:predicted  nucleic acid-binding Zn-ribbon protein
MAVDNQFNAIIDKLHLLMKGMERLKKENGKLKSELEAAKGREAAALQRIEDLQQQASILKLAVGDMNEKDKKTFEKKINQYIKEIDKCINYLSQ